LVRDGGAKLVDYCYMGGLSEDLSGGEAAILVGAAENRGA